MALKNDALTARCEGRIGLENVYLYQTNLFLLTCFEWRLKNDAMTARCEGGSD